MAYTPPIEASTTKKGIIQLGGDLGGPGTTAGAPVLKDVARANRGGAENLTSNTSATGAVTLDLALANVFSLTLTGNTTLTFTGASAGKACSFSLYVKQDATGGRTVSWASSIRWSGGVPTLSTAANATDILVFETINGGTNWYGSLVGTNFV